MSQVALFSETVTKYQNATISIRLTLFFIDTAVGFAPGACTVLIFNNGFMSPQLAYVS